MGTALSRLSRSRRWTRTPCVRSSLLRSVCSPRRRVLLLLLLCITMFTSSVFYVSTFLKPPSFSLPPSLSASVVLQKGRADALRDCSHARHVLFTTMGPRLSREKSEVRDHMLFGLAMLNAEAVRREKGKPNARRTAGPLSLQVYINATTDGFVENEFGTPILGSMFRETFRRCPHAETFTFFNSDLVFDSGFLDTADAVADAASRARAAKTRGQAGVGGDSNAHANDEGSVSFGSAPLDTSPSPSNFPSSSWFSWGPSKPVMDAQSEHKAEIKSRFLVVGRRTEVSLHRMTAARHSMSSRERDSSDERGGEHGSAAQGWKGHIIGGKRYQDEDAAVDEPVDAFDDMVQGLARDYGSPSHKWAVDYFLVTRDTFRWNIDTDTSVDEFAANSDQHKEGPRGTPAASHELVSPTETIPNSPNKPVHSPLVPPFVIGRAGYDNWLVQTAILDPSLDVIDATNTITCLHISDASGGQSWKTRNDPDKLWNKDLFVKGHTWTDQTVRHARIATRWEDEREEHTDQGVVFYRRPPYRACQGFWCLLVWRW